MVVLVTLLCMLNSFYMRNFLTNGLEEVDHFLGLHVRQITDVITETTKEQQNRINLCIRNNGVHC